MDEYISRKKAVDACFDGWNNTPHDCAENIRQIPAADVRPVVRGKWFKNGYSIRCSECGYDMPFTVRNFCPNCGADMREET